MKMTPTQLESINNFNPSKLKLAFTTVSNDTIVDEDTDVHSKPAIKKVTIKEPETEIIHRDRSPTLLGPELQPSPPQSEPTKQLTQVLHKPNKMKENLVLLGMGATLFMVDQMYGLPGVALVLLASQGIGAIAERTHLVQPSQAHHVKAMVGAATWSGCFVSAWTHVGAPVALAGSLVGFAAGLHVKNTESLQEAKYKNSHRL